MYQDLLYFETAIWLGETTEYSRLTWLKPTYRKEK